MCVHYFKMSPGVSCDIFYRLKLENRKDNAQVKCNEFIRNGKVMSLYVNVWDDCTFARKRYTNLVPLLLSLLTPTFGNSVSLRPMLFSKREKEYSKPFIRLIRNLWLHISPGTLTTPLITFPNFQNCAREKFFKFIFFSIYLTWGNFQTHYACDIWLGSLKFSI